MGGDWYDVFTLLERLNHKFGHFEPDAMATMLCAVISPALDQIRLSSAGTTHSEEDCASVMAAMADYVPRTRHGPAHLRRQPVSSP